MDFGHVTSTYMHTVRAVMEDDFLELTGCASGAVPVTEVRALAVEVVESCRVVARIRLLADPALVRP
jgi:hypothetical protein